MDKFTQVLEEHLAGIFQNALELALRRINASAPVKTSASRGRKPRTSTVKTPGVSGKKSAGEPRAWIFGKGMKSLRKKLGLSQALFAKLMGVSAQAVALWERKSGRLRLRKTTLARLAEVRTLGARAAAQKLADMGVKKGRPGRKSAGAGAAPSKPAPKKPVVRRRARKAPAKV
jgi:transcriptional regulator with XRE-family HTH domain